MVTLNRKFNFGDKLAIDNRDLYNQLSDMYEDISGVVNGKASTKAMKNQDPPASSPANANYKITDIFVREDTNQAWILTSRTSTNDVTWTLIT